MKLYQKAIELIKNLGLVCRLYTSFSKDFIGSDYGVRNCEIDEDGNTVRFVQRASNSDIATVSEKSSDGRLKTRTFVLEKVVRG